MECLKQFKFILFIKDKELNEKDFWKNFNWQFEDEKEEKQKRASAIPINPSHQISGPAKEIKITSSPSPNVTNTNQSLSNGDISFSKSIGSPNSISPASVSPPNMDVKHQKPKKKKKKKKEKMKKHVIKIEGNEARDLFPKEESPVDNSLQNSELEVKEIDVNELVILRNEEVKITSMPLLTQSLDLEKRITPPIQLIDLEDDELHDSEEDKSEFLKTVSLPVLSQLSHIRETTEEKVEETNDQNFEEKGNETETKLVQGNADKGLESVPQSPSKHENFNAEELISDVLDKMEEINFELEASAEEVKQQEVIEEKKEEQEVLEEKKEKQEKEESLLVEKESATSETSAQGPEAQKEQYRENENQKEKSDREEKGEKRSENKVQTVGARDSEEEPLKKDSLESISELRVVNVLEKSGHSRNQDLLARVNEAIKEVLLESQSGQRVLYKSSPSAIKLCASVEHVLLDGFCNKAGIMHKVNILHKVGIFDKEAYWPYLKHLPSCLPSTGDFLESIKSNKDVQTDLGRARCFIFFSLNQQSLSEFLESLRMDESLTCSFYSADSFWRDEDMVNIFLSLLNGLKAIQFQLDTFESHLDDVDAWNLSFHISGNSHQKLGDNSFTQEVERKKKRSKRVTVVNIVDSPEFGKREKAATLEEVPTHSPQMLLNEIISNIKAPQSRKNSEQDLEKKKISSASLQQVEEQLKLEESSKKEEGKDIEHDSLKGEIETKEIRVEKIEEKVDEKVEKSPEKVRKADGESPTNEKVDKIARVKSQNFGVEDDESHEKFEWVGGKLIKVTTKVDKGEVEEALNTLANLPSFDFSESDLILSNPTSPSSSRKPGSKEEKLTATRKKPVIKLNSIPPLSNYIIEDYFPNKNSMPISNIDPSFRASMYVSSSNDSLSKDIDTLSAFTKSERSFKGEINKNSSLRATMYVSSTLEADSPKDSNTIIKSHKNKEENVSVYVGSKFKYIFLKDSSPVKNAKCPNCSSGLSYGLFGNARYCTYTNLHFCKEPNCFGNEKSVIPSKVVFEWNFAPFPVSVPSKKFIDANAEKSAFDVENINPKIYQLSFRLKAVRIQRLQFEILAEYINTCARNASMPKINPVYEFIVKQVIDFYTLKALNDVNTGALSVYLDRVIGEMKDHITKTCEACQLKGSYCEGCRSEEILYKFDFEKVRECSECNALFHTKCFKSPKNCPKCNRKKKFGNI